jgi:hypothetical protein
MTRTCTIKIRHLGAALLIISICGCVADGLSPQERQSMSQYEKVVGMIQSSMPVGESVVSDKAGNPVFKFVDSNGDGKIDQRFKYDSGQKQWIPVR